MKHPCILLALIIGLVLFTACQTTVHNPPAPRPEPERIIVREPVPPKKTVIIVDENTEEVVEEGTIVR